MLREEPPSAPPKNIVASGRTNQSIMVQWQPPPEPQLNGVLRGYVLRYASIHTSSYMLHKLLPPYLLLKGWWHNENWINVTFFVPWKYVCTGTRALYRCLYRPWLSVLQFDVYLKYDILGIINLPSTASLEFAYNCRRRCLVFILVQCLLICLHLRKLLNRHTFDGFRFLLLSHLLVLFLAATFLLSSVISFYSTFNLLLFSAPLWMSVCQMERQGKRVISSPVGLRSPLSVLLVCVFGVHVRQICVSADSCGKTEYLVTPVLICRLLCSDTICRKPKCLWTLQRCCTCIFSTL